MPNLASHLELLHKKLLTMGALVEDAVRRASQTLTEQQLELVEAIVKDDKRIDALENTIDRDAHNLLALQQPVAGDLRLVLLVLMTNNELERIGDHAKNIAKIAGDLTELARLPAFALLQEICDLTNAMLGSALDALINKDAAIARELLGRDKILDRACATFKEALAQEMTEQPALVRQGMQALLATHNLERIGDLATNIAKEIVYFVEGTMLRHNGRFVGTDTETIKRRQEAMAAAESAERLNRG